MAPIVPNTIRSIRASVASVRLFSVALQILYCLCISANKDADDLADGRVTVRSRACNRTAAAAEMYVINTYDLCNNKDGGSISPVKVSQRRKEGGS